MTDASNNYVRFIRWLSLIYPDRTITKGRVCPGRGPLPDSLILCLSLTNYTLYLVRLPKAGVSLKVRWRANCTWKEEGCTPAGKCAFAFSLLMAKRDSGVLSSKGSEEASACPKPEPLTVCGANIRFAPPCRAATACSSELSSIYSPLY